MMYLVINSKTFILVSCSVTVAENGTTYVDPKAQYKRQSHIVHIKESVREYEHFENAGYWKNRVLHTLYSSSICQRENEAVELCIIFTCHY